MRTTRALLAALARPEPPAMAARRTAALVAGALAAYGAMLGTVAQPSTVTAASAMPIVVAGWRGGTRLGVLFGVVMVVLNCAAFTVLEPEALGSSVFFVGAVVGIGLGAVVGSLRELLQRAAQMTAELDSLTRGLEERVAEKTSALERSYSLLRAAFDATADGLLVVDAAGAVVSANRKFYELWGLDERAGLDDGTVARLRSTLVDPARWTSSEDAAYERLELRDGRVFERHARPQVLAGDSVGRVISFRDVTEQRKTQEALASAAKLDAVGRLAGGVAHDFNNLLVVILNYTTFALDAVPEDSPARADLQEVTLAAERAASLTRQLLAFSRKQVIEPAVVELNDVVHGLDKMLRRLLGEDIVVVTRLDPAAGCVLADRGQLEQVVVNLAVNARDAMPRGGELQVTTERTLRDGRSWVCLTVRDTGTGMDAETMRHIFEPFFTTKGVGRGTGLGLAMVYGIVHQSGGTLEVESELGAGSTFRALLPQQERPPTVSRRPSPAREEARGHETVLLVEDEGALRNVTERMLRNAGYQVLAASDATDALGLYERHGHSVDLVLTDVVMPQVSGVALVERLRAGDPSLRALFMSGYTDDAIARHDVERLGVRILPKPFTAEQLHAALRDVLGEEARLTRPPSERVPSPGGEDALDQR